MRQKNLMVISSAEQLLEGRTRREFLKLVGLGGAVVFLPSVLTSCNDSNNDVTGPPGSGSPLVIDFAKGDIAVLQFAYALEQLEADFYTKVVANFSSSLTASEQTVLGDIKNHEVIHREALKAVLGSSNDFTVHTTYGSLDFSNRAAVLTTARTFEDLGVAAYNGAAQYLSSTANLLVAGKIVSVEARHASAIRDLIAPSTSSQGDTGTSFAPKSFDDVFSPGKVKTNAQAFVVEQITFSNAPSTFVQGPNNNG
ncbi:MAG: ferritin-like domain-containing protein [Gemmatimonadota bacterium]|nr:ferritin-like domain-containing protein [Gemmatimonadota bacterium]